MDEPIDFDHDYIKSLIKSEKYILQGMTTLCILTLTFGHRLVGQAHCLNPERFDKQLGKDTARTDAVNQLYAKEAYRLQYRPPVK